MINGYRWSQSGGPYGDTLSGDARGFFIELDTALFS